MKQVSYESLINYYQNDTIENEYLMSLAIDIVKTMNPAKVSYWEESHNKVKNFVLNYIVESTIISSFSNLSWNGDFPEEHIYLHEGKGNNKADFINIINNEPVECKRSITLGYFKNVSLKNSNLHNAKYVILYVESTDSIYKYSVENDSYELLVAGFLEQAGKLKIYRYISNYLPKLIY